PSVRGRTWRGFVSRTGVFSIMLPGYAVTAVQMPRHGFREARRGRSVQEDIGEERLVGGARHRRVAGEVGDAGTRQHVLDDERLSGVLPGRSSHDLVGG